MRKLFIWNEKYETGIMRIDLQHEGIFELANRMHAAHMARSGLRAASEIANELIDYAYEHFQSEEAFMLGLGYSDFERHVQKHRSVEARLVQLAEALGQGDERQEDLYRFICKWLGMHILQSDFKFAHELTRTMAS